MDRSEIARPAFLHNSYQQIYPPLPPDGWYSLQVAAIAILLDSLIHITSLVSVGTWAGNYDLRAQIFAKRTRT